MRLARVLAVGGIFLAAFPSSANPHDLHHFASKGRDPVAMQSDIHLAQANWQAQQMLRQQQQMDQMRRQQQQMEQVRRQQQQMEQVRRQQQMEQMRRQQEQVRQQQMQRQQEQARQQQNQLRMRQEQTQRLQIGQRQNQIAIGQRAPSLLQDRTTIISRGSTIRGAASAGMNSSALRLRAPSQSVGWRQAQRSGQTRSPSTDRLQVARASTTGRLPFPSQTRTRSLTVQSAKATAAGASPGRSEMYRRPAGVAYARAGSAARNERSAVGWAMLTRYAVPATPQAGGAGRGGGKRPPAVVLNRPSNDNYFRYSPANDNKRIKWTRARQKTMERDNVAFNITPINLEKEIMRRNDWKQQIGEDGKGTFLTDRRAINSMLKHAIKSNEGGNKFKVPAATARRIERELDLAKGSLSGGFRVRMVQNLNTKEPVLPQSGNRFFRGYDKHTSGGHPEMAIKPISLIDSDPDVSIFMEVEIE